MTNTTVTKINSNEVRFKTDPVSYFYSAEQAFHSAIETVGLRLDRSYRIADYTIRLSFAGKSLLPYICPALDHLSIETEKHPDLTIYLWDSASTGTEMPPPPWSLSDYGVRGEISGYNDQRISLCFRHGSGAVSLLDGTLGQAIFWIRDAHQLPFWESAAPLLNILNWWMVGHDRLLVHGAAVASDRGAALIVGRGGSGKSTTALACLRAGLSYLGDDYVMISTRPRRSIHSVYSTAKLDANQVNAFPQLVSKVSNKEMAPQEKALLFLNDHYRKQMTPTSEVKLVLVPRVTGRERTQMHKTSVAAALAAVAPSTIFQLPRAGEYHFKFLAEFLSALPCYVLDCGRDLNQLPEVVRAALAIKVT